MKPRVGERLARAGIICLLLPFASVTRALAQAGAPGSIFDFGAGARPLGMGGAYTALAKDASSLYYNPAGLSMLNGRNVSFMHAALFEGMSYDYLGYAQNYARLPGGWGAQVLKLAAGAAEGRDENNQPTGGFTYGETALAAGTGLHGLFLPSLSMGASVKVLNRTLGNASNRLIGFDIGAQYGPLLDDRLTVALAVSNFGSFATGDTADKLPFGVKFGAAYSLSSNILVSADLSGSSGFRFGTEYGIGPAAVRLGYDRNSFSFGGGVKFLKAYQLDYAMLRNPVLGLSNRISLSYFFGKAVAAPPKVRGYAPDYIKRAGADIEARNYAAAYEGTQMAIGMDPAVRKGPWAEKSRRLESLVSGLKLKELPERQKVLMADTPQAKEAGEAANEYIDGNNARAMLLAHSSLGYEPGNAFFSEFLKTMSEVTHLEIRNDEILPRVPLEKEKLRKSESFFQVLEYDKSVKECEEVLLLDDKNDLAWTRLGSAYFALGDLERSRKAYLKALELNPGNASVLQFMQLQGWTR